MTNFDRDEAVMKFARQLRGMGLIKALHVRVEQKEWRYRSGWYLNLICRLSVIPCGSKDSIFQWEINQYLSR